MIPDLDVCYVTTTGRRTGQPHRIEIWYGVGGDRTIYLLSGGGRRSDWVRNIEADGAVTVRIGGDDRHGVARIVTDDGEDGDARRLLAAKYQSWREGQPMSSWARTALPVAIDLVDRDA